MKQYKDLTDYPKIYERCYWGQPSIENMVPTEEIIRNRNNFVKDYGIKRWKDHQTFKVHTWVQLQKNSDDSLPLDHIEMYFLGDSDLILIVSSPYGEHDQKYESKGWKKIYPLYSLNASTYIIFKDRNFK